MAYTAPDTAAFMLRFPAFSAVNPTLVTEVLGEAAGVVDTTWLERDFALAQMLYAAHVLTLDGHGSGADADAIEQGAGLYKSVRAGDTAIEFANVSGGTLAATSFGRRFLEMQDRNFAGPLVARGQLAPCSPLAFDCDPVVF